MQDPQSPLIPRRDYLKWLGAAGLAATDVSGHAQSAWPNKPIRWIIPFAPGGTSSIVARGIAAQLTKQLGATFVIDNKGGGGGSPADYAAFVAREQARWKEVVIKGQIRPG